MKDVLEKLIRRWRVELANTLMQASTNPIDSETFGSVMELTAFFLGGRKELAKKLEVSQAEVSRFCNGKMHRNPKYAQFLITEKIPNILLEGIPGT
jgi:transcriptional regulator with XRE-family HTH domain